MTAWRCNWRASLSRQDEVITFVNRNLEPCRGYHVFMRALPELLRRRPHARVLITGGDGVSYGAAPTNGQTWKQIYIDEDMPSTRTWTGRACIFWGRSLYAQFVAMLQLSRVHLYLTYPFVLSWSLLEAMSAGLRHCGQRHRPCARPSATTKPACWWTFSTRPRWPKPPANCWTTQPGAHAWGRPLASLPVRITT